MTPPSVIQPNQRLGTPTGIIIPAVRHKMSFAYLECVSIEQDSNGVAAIIANPTLGTQRAYLPAANLACILLGPGTRITQAAASTLARHGTTIGFVGAGAVRCYSTYTNLAATTSKIADQQARIVSHQDLRIEAARRLYQLRWDTDLPDHLTLDRLRGMEGRRMRDLYQTLATKHRVRFRRTNSDSWDTQDPVNKAMSAANTGLYGITTAVITALGAIPSLGILHTGSNGSFVYDIADILKPTVTVPLAFRLANSADPEREARRALRQDFTALRCIPKLIDCIYNALDLTRDNDVAHHRGNVTELWNWQGPNIPARINHSEQP